MTIKNEQWVRAYTNIAFIKYWGKKDEELMLPQNNSLSLTLDAFYTDTMVIFDDTFTEDTLYIDNIKQDQAVLKKAQIILDLVRQQANITQCATIYSINHVPTAAGLASSASGLAALAGAASQAAGLQLSKKEISKLARRGSGSASRSIYGGFVEWIAGSNDKDSYAVPIDQADWDIGMIFIIVDDGEKEISSTVGMQRVVDTSPYYDGWLTSTADDLIAIKEAIKSKDFNKLGSLAESSALKMHALNLSAQPPFNYWSPDSIKAMHMVSELRNAGFSVYLTMDAGPNVKLICKLSEMKKIEEYLITKFDREQLVMAKPGPGIEFFEK